MFIAGQQYLSPSTAFIHLGARDVGIVGTPGMTPKVEGLLKILVLPREGWWAWTYLKGWSNRFLVLEACADLNDPRCYHEVHRHEIREDEREKRR